MTVHERLADKDISTMVAVWKQLDQLPKFAHDDLENIVAFATAAVTDNPVAFLKATMPCLNRNNTPLYNAAIGQLEDADYDSKTLNDIANEAGFVPELHKIILDREMRTGDAEDKAYHALQCEQYDVALEYLDKMLINGQYKEAAELTKRKQFDTENDTQRDLSRIPVRAAVQLALVEQDYRSVNNILFRVRRPDTSWVPPETLTVMSKGLLGIGEWGAAYSLATTACNDALCRDILQTKADERPLLVYEEANHKGWTDLVDQTRAAAVQEDPAETYRIATRNNDFGMMMTSIDQHLRMHREGKDTDLSHAIAAYANTLHTRYQYETRGEHDTAVYSRLNSLYELACCTLLMADPMEAYFQACGPAGIDADQDTPFAERALDAIKTQPMSAATLKSHYEQNIGGDERLLSVLRERLAATGDIKTLWQWKGIDDHAESALETAAQQNLGVAPRVLHKYFGTKYEVTLDTTALVTDQNSSPV